MRQLVPRQVMNIRWVCISKGLKQKCWCWSFGSWKLSRAWHFVSTFVRLEIIVTWTELHWPVSPIPSKATWRTFRSFATVCVLSKNSRNLIWIQISSLYFPQYLFHILFQMYFYIFLLWFIYIVGVPLFLTFLAWSNLVHVFSFPPVFFKFLSYTYNWRQSPLILSECCNFCPWPLAESWWVVSHDEMTRRTANVKGKNQTSERLPLLKTSWLASSHEERTAKWMKGTEELVRRKWIWINMKHTRRSRYVKYCIRKWYIII